MGETAPRLFPSPGTALKGGLTAIAVTLSAAKGLFCLGRKRSFAALRMTSTCVLVVGAFHASWVSRRLMVTPGEGRWGFFSDRTTNPVRQGRRKQPNSMPSIALTCLGQLEAE